MTASTVVSPPTPPPPADAPPTVIAARRLSKTFGEKVAVDAVDLNVPAGVIVGVIGPSGCGKSTVVRLLTGIISPDDGDVRVFGADPATFSTRQRTRFGYMPQSPVLFPNLTIWGNLSFIASVYGLPIRRRKAHLLRLLELVDLTAERGRRMSDSSGGMQRRLALAATLVHEPELLFLDEPTAGVDPILRRRFWEHFRMLRDLGRTIIVPTQYVGEAVSCDLVAVMAAGRIITVQPPAALPRFAFGGDPLLMPFDDGWASEADVQRLLALPFVRSAERVPDGLVVVVDHADAGTAALVAHAGTVGLASPTITPYEPSIDDTFVRIIEQHRQNGASSESVAA